MSFSSSFFSESFITVDTGSFVYIQKILISELSTTEIILLFYVIYNKIF